MALLRSKYLPMLLYGTEACQINAAVKHSLEFTINRVLFKIFGAAAKETYREIWNYFGIDAIEKQIADRYSKFIIRYSSSENVLCQSISKVHIM